MILKQQNVVGQPCCDHPVPCCGAKSYKQLVLCAIKATGDAVCEPGHINGGVGPPRKTPERELLVLRLRVSRNLPPEA